MSQPSYLVMALDIANLLLVAAGLLLVYFDWSAARRREFLYLYFTEERPGASYFNAARNRRAQFTRLLAAFLALLFRQFLLALMAASVSSPNAWDDWVRWWQDGTLSTSITFAVSLIPWISVFEMLGIGLLALGLLYKPTQDRESTDLLTASFIAAWTLFVFLLVVGLFGDNTLSVVRGAAMLTRAAVVGWVVWKLFGQHRQTEEELNNRRKDGLLRFETMAVSIAFSAWLLGHILTIVLANPAASSIGITLAFLPIVMFVARDVLGEYEMVESSRHRMGRERQVIFSFLQRIGAAFTTAVEVDEVLRIVAESALETTEAQSGAIYLYHADTGVLEPRVVQNFFPPLYVDTPAAKSEHRYENLKAEMEHQSFQLGEGIIGEVAQTGKARIVDNVQTAGIMLGSTAEYMRNKSMLVVPLRIRDEPLGVMAVLCKQRGSFGRDDQLLLQALADQGALSINYAMLTDEVRQQERLRRELQIARDIQQHLLPDKCPIIPGFEIAARATSATEVGGDYYDFFTVDDDRLGIVVADVSGKGVHAALVVAMIRSAFRAQARGNSDVRDVLTGVNDFISKDLPQNMFITCVYGILQISTSTFSWARAGHEPLIVAHDNAPIDVLSPDGFALGVIDSAEFGDLLQVEHTHLKPGDRVLMFTDGLTEAMNAEGEEFGMQRILRVMDHQEDPILESSVNGHHATSESDPTKATILPKRPNPCDENGKAQGKKESGNGSNDKVLNGSGKNSDAPASPCGPELSVEEPEELRIMERAVERHVDGAPQSDDLTIVYLMAK